MIQKTAHRGAAENAEEEHLFSLAGVRPAREKGLPHAISSSDCIFVLSGAQRRRLRRVPLTEKHKKLKLSALCVSAVPSYFF